VDYTELSQQLSSSPFTAVPIVFIAGVLTSLTPCIYPMIPITAAIVGGGAASADQPRRPRYRSALLTFSYVLGLAAVYAAVGLFAGMTGTMFGAVSTNPWLYFAMANLLVLAALAMLDVVPVRIPSRLLSRAAGARGTVQQSRWNPHRNNVEHCEGREDEQVRHREIQPWVGAYGTEHRAGHAGKQPDRGIHGGQSEYIGKREQGGAIAGTPRLLSRRSASPDDRRRYRAHRIDARRETCQHARDEDDRHGSERTRGELLRQLGVIHVRDAVRAPTPTRSSRPPIPMRDAARATIHLSSG